MSQRASKHSAEQAGVIHDPSRTEHPAALNEREWVKRLKAGDPDAFTELVEANQQKLFAALFRLMGNREEAEDLLQETFIKVVRKIDSFSEESSLSTWLYRIAINTGLSRGRKLARRNDVISFSADHRRDDDSTSLIDRAADTGTDCPEQAAIRAETMTRIRNAIDSLPDGYREAVFLRDIEGMNYHDVAGIMDIPVATVKTRLHRARMMLAGKLADLRIDGE